MTYDPGTGLPTTATNDPSAPATDKVDPLVKLAADVHAIRNSVGWILAIVVAGILISAIIGWQAGQESSGY